MDILPNELILIIFRNIPLITDKRHFLRTCILYNNITKQLFKQYEMNYIMPYFRKNYYYCVENFTLELCHDKYFDMIPKSYIIPSNEIIVSALATFYNIPIQIDKKKNNEIMDYCKNIFNIGKSWLLNINLPLLELVKNNDYDMSKVCEIAALHGNLDMIKWARSNDYKWNENTCSGAALNGHLDILIWARENGCYWNSQTCSAAALGGHLNILKWARENYCSWDEQTCSNAALNGHLGILIWARENYCNWDAQTCSNAALNNHLGILIWARKNGCDWNSRTCSNAAENGHLEILKWTRENGGYELTKKTPLYAILDGNLEVLIWAMENGCEWDSDMCFCNVPRHSEILKWTKEKGYKWKDPCRCYIRKRFLFW